MCTVFYLQLSVIKFFIWLSLHSSASLRVVLGPAEPSLWGYLLEMHSWVSTQKLWKSDLEIWVLRRSRVSAAA